jgi:hypothetical protein
LILECQPSSKKRQKSRISGIDCFLKNDRATESAISIVERDSRSKNKMKARKKGVRRSEAGMYGNSDTTVFDVRRDLIQILNDMKSSSPIPKCLDSRIRAIKMIVREVRQRMVDANRTLPEALGDLERIRFKFADNGGTGTIAELVVAIKFDSGIYRDERRKVPMKLNYVV